jgi:hypothetical protein
LPGELGARRLCLYRSGSCRNLLRHRRPQLKRQFLDTVGTRPHLDVLPPLRACVRARAGKAATHGVSRPAQHQGAHASTASRPSASARRRTGGPGTSRALCGAGSRLVRARGIPREPARLTPSKATTVDAAAAMDPVPRWRCDRDQKASTSRQVTLAGDLRVCLLGHDVYHGG